VSIFKKASLKNSRQNERILQTTHIGFHPAKFYSAWRHHVVTKAWTRLELSNYGIFLITVLFFRDSMLLSGLSLVVTIILRCLTSTSAAPPLWAARIISWILHYRAGQLLLRLKLSAEVNMYIICLRKYFWEKSCILENQYKGVLRFTWFLFAGLYLHVACASLHHVKAFIVFFWKK
jgi:hypothetical protein